MGLSSSKHKYQQPYHPSKIPTYGRGQGYMQNHGPGFIPGQMHGQYGYMPQPGQFPPGFVPTGYGPLPQPLLSWPTQNKPRKRKSRKNREREPGGFRPSTHGTSSWIYLAVSYYDNPPVCSSDAGVTSSRPWFHTTKRWSGIPGTTSNAEHNYNPTSTNSVYASFHGS